MYFHSSEKEEGWESFVENAVIEKCQKAGGDLHHVFVDKTSKEVIMRMRVDINVNSTKK